MTIGLVLTGAIFGMIADAVASAVITWPWVAIDMVGNGVEPFKAIGGGLLLAFMAAAVGAISGGQVGAAVGIACRLCPSRRRLVHVSIGALIGAAVALLSLYSGYHWLPFLPSDPHSLKPERIEWLIKVIAATACGGIVGFALHRIRFHAKP